MSWDSKVDFSDDEILTQPICKDLLPKISNLQQDLKSGDYVLIKFKPVGKKNCYKYVATVVKVISKTEVEVQYFEASDEENTEFALVKGDISVLDLASKF
jgi:hypothetical protein